MEKENPINFNEQIKNTIKKNLVSLREANGLKMRDVATALGIKENTYRVWEDPQKGCPKQADLVKIARMYNISLDMLMTGKMSEQNKGVFTVRAKDPFEDHIYGDKYLSELSKYEKIVIMKIRQMNAADRSKVNELIEEICAKFNQQ